MYTTLWGKGFPIQLCNPMVASVKPILSGGGKTITLVGGKE